ncbi:MAG: sugar transferase [Deltaproteobacteria bacterium]|nr:sugar transferase [Deltaproteobacteria bacterium]
MWRKRSAFLRQTVIAFDVIVSAAAFFATLFVRDWLARAEDRTGPIATLLKSIGGVPPGINPADYQWLLIGLAPIWAVSFHYASSGDLRLIYRRAAYRYAKATLLGLGLFILATFVFKLLFVARSFVLLFGAVQFTALLLGRVALVEATKIIRRRRGDGHRVVIVGSDATAVAFLESLRKHSPWSINLVGFVQLPGEAVDVRARPQLGFIGSLAGVLDRQPVDEVVFAVHGKQPEIFKAAITACDDRGVDVLLTLPPQYPSSGTVEVANVSGFDYPMLGLRRVPTDEARLAVKRLLDIAGSLFGLLLASPIMLAAAIAVRIESEGPLLFRQIRAGRNGRKFTMLKFRSMVVDAEKLRAKLDHLNEMDGPVFKIRHDPRITKVGRFIRKTSLDELPQLFNVLMGDMSLVGPRPALPSEVEQYQPWQRRRLSVKPGLTGLWQVSGRNQVDFEEWMQLDLRYIDTWSLWLDIKIILKTVPTVLFHKGAS